MASERNDAAGYLGWFFLGGIIGAAAALLVAPKTGRETRREVERIGEVTEHVESAAAGMSRVVVALGGLARAGQVVGLAAGLRRGVDVFVSRLRRDEGDNSHGK